MPKATVTNIQRYSLHDGGGIRTVVFFKGCPFRCPWCANPENLSYEPEVSLKESLCIRCSRTGDAPCPRKPSECPTNAKELLGEERTVDELVQACLRDKVFYEESGGGATFSGGECLAPVSRQDFVLELARALKAEGVDVAIETTLALPVPRLAELAEVVDTWLVDFKIADRTKSLDVIGLDPEIRDANLEVLLGLGAKVVARMPIIPGFTDEAVAKNIEDLKRLGIRRADVLPFHQLGEAKYAQTGRAYGLSGLEPLHEEDVAWIAEALEAAGIEACIHGE
jgi:pyruvate formate lyase activating enzyme